MRDASHLTDVYGKRADLYHSLGSRMKKHIQWAGFLRLVLFMLIFGFVYAFAVTTDHAWLIASILSLALFIAMVAISVRKKSARDLYNTLEKINDNEIQILNSKPSAFHNGQIYMEQNGYSKDLDIFGPGSLFHLLNRTGTIPGRNALARHLQKPPTHIPVINAHQESIRELAGKLDFRQKIQALGILGSDAEEKEVSTVSRNINAGIPHGLILILMITGPLLIAGSILYYMLYGYGMFIVHAFVMNVFIAVMFSGKIRSLQAQVTGKNKQLSTYAAIYRLIAGEMLRTRLLSGIYQTSHEAQRGLRKLSRIAEQFDRRMNLIAYLFLNGIYLYDLYCAYSLRQWIKRYRQRESIWLRKLAEMEKLCSLAGFHYNYPDYVFPELTADRITYKAKEMGHPLIPRQNRITNSIDPTQERPIYLITGSNMSGKSTFLRTLGINLVLARAGAPVCAAEMQCYPLTIYTSIHLSDSLRENKSLFYAELEKLRYIITGLKAGVPGLVLIDEMLKGTNTDDKSYGSAAFIKQLIRCSCIAFIATHDIQLAKLAQDHPGEIANKCFESTIENGRLIFDYKIRDGVSQNKNATFLMEKMGIIRNKINQVPG
ncbi:MAG: hypothetical protein R6T99_10860 [Bacteroidales bacterium]